jgi:AraC-like DNA-binding protein
MDATAPKVLRFSTDDFPPEKRLAAYREIYGSTIIRHDVTPIGVQPFRFEATFCNLPRLGLMSSLISACRRWHGPQHLTSDDFVLGVGLGGARCIVEQCGRDAMLGEGRAVLTNCAEPALVVLPDAARPLSIRIPRAVLAARIPGLDDRTSQTIPASAALKLLTSYVATIWDAGSMEPRLRDLVIAHVHDLVALVLGAEGDARELAEQHGPRAARLSAILQAIKTNSADPRLSVGAVAAALAVSPRYVHILLEETGKSFTHHVLTRRLDNAAALLRDPNWRDRRITDIATTVGFSDLSYFNRAFRRHFGATPSDIRNGGAPARRPS